MHVPDHLLNDPTEVVAAVSAVAVVATTSTLGARRSRSATALRRPPESAATVLDHPDRAAPQLAVAALVFALQMVNFPVLSGTSGHLLGGALATALIGPRRALLALTAVVASQALFFGDGGVGALGVNLWLIAILPVAVASAAGSLLRRRPPTTTAARLGVPALAALVAPAVSALVFSLLHGLTGASAAGLGGTVGPMLRVHLAIGLGEAAITVAVLAAVATVPRLDIARLTPVATVWGLALSSAALLSTVASTHPDGLERVATDLGFAVEGPTSILSGGPLQDYALSGMSGSAATSAAGLLGLALTSAVAVALVAADGATRRTRAAAPARIG
jgi:cobalt/nickel transport system permease protein